MIDDGIRLIEKECKHQHEEWGFDHDIMTHGSEDLLTASCIVIMGFDGIRDECRFPWALDLHKKHVNDFVRRAMISGALCATAINVKTFEIGREHRAQK